MNMDDDGELIVSEAETTMIAKNYAKLVRELKHLFEERTAVIVEGDEFNNGVTIGYGRAVEDMVRVLIHSMPKDLQNDLQKKMEEEENGC